LNDFFIYSLELKVVGRKQKWIIFMSSGGKFAGAIYHKDKCVKHKTFSRYSELILVIIINSEL
jgi:hypothetical protein